MMSLVLSLLGATFLYAGIEMANEDATAAVGSVLFGLILAIKPAIAAVQQLRALSGGAPASSRKGRGRAPHLKLVKTEKDEQVTIH